MSYSLFYHAIVEKDSLDFFIVEHFFSLNSINQIHSVVFIECIFHTAAQIFQEHDLHKDNMWCFQLPMLCLFIPNGNIQAMAFTLYTQLAVMLNCLL